MVADGCVVRNVLTDIRKLFQQQTERAQEADKAKKLHSKKRARNIIDSDSDDDVILTTPKSKINSKPKKEEPSLIPITPGDYFKQFPSKSFDNSKHEATTKSITRNEADSTSSLNANGTKSEVVPPAKKQRTEEHSSQGSSQSPNLVNEIAGLEIQMPIPSTPTATNTPTAHKLSSSSTKNTSATKSPLVRTTSSNASNYFAYMSRAGPANLGGKQIPSGEANCLGNLTFVITGVLDSLEREDAKDLIEKHGGRVVGSISKKVTHLVVGLDAGESKMAKARQQNVAEISEDQLLGMIRTRPASAVKSVTPASSKKKSKPSGKMANTSLDISPTSAQPIAYTFDISEPTSSQSKQDIKMEVEILKPKSVPAQDAPCLLLVDKYRPTCVREIIGASRDTSPASKLMRWLRDWFSVNRGGGVKESKPASKADFFKKNPANFKAVLLSGPPGIGKTTTATLVCRELGLSYVELNASSTRSKSSLQDSVSQMLTNTTLCPSSIASRDRNERHVLVMDEVDGMAGNEDRGGVQELIALIKTTKIPIICICNDRQHPKMRTLVHYCFDLPVSRPDIEQVKTAMMKINYKEGIKIPPKALEEMIIASNHDIRQVIHNISMWTADSKVLSYEDAKSNAQNAKKVVAKGPFDVIKQVFQRPEANPVDEKMDLFFQDYSIGPLFVQENYPLIRPFGAKGDLQRHLDLMAMGADSISTGDIISQRIRSAQGWKLLPMQGFFSTVYPGQLLLGSFAGKIEFPKWLGNNSKCTKYQRIMGELCTHTRLHTSGSIIDLSLDYVPSWYQKVTRALEHEEIQEASSFLCEYELLKEDWDSISELGLFKGHRDVMSQIPPKVKAQLTRVTNKGRGHVHYRSDQSFRKQKVMVEGEFDEMEVDEQSSGENTQDLSQNQMIQVKQVTTKKPAATKAAGKGSQKGKRTKK